jgi:hypothetical protein
MNRSIAFPGRTFAPLAALVCTACPGKLEDAGRFIDASDDVVVGDNDAATGNDGGCPDVPTLFHDTCGTAGCHAATAPAQFLDLQSPDLGTRLAGACATESAGYLIDPTNPRASVIYAKLTAAPPSGNRMPLSKPPFDDGQLACVLAWASAQKGTLRQCDAGAPPTDARPD